MSDRDRRKPAVGVHGRANDDDKSLQSLLAFVPPCCPPGGLPVLQDVGSDAALTGDHALLESTDQGLKRPLAATRPNDEMNPSTLKSPTPSLLAEATVDPLWSDAAAESWVDAFPVGNGRLGALIWGQPWNERMPFSEDTLYTSPKSDSRRKTTALVARPRTRPGWTTP